MSERLATALFSCLLAALLRNFTLILEIGWALVEDLVLVLNVDLSEGSLDALNFVLALVRLSTLASFASTFASAFILRLFLFLLSEEMLRLTVLISG